MEKERREAPAAMDAAAMRSEVMVLTLCVRDVVLGMNSRSLAVAFEVMTVLSAICDFAHSHQNGCGADVLRVSQGMKKQP